MKHKCPECAGRGEKWVQVFRVFNVTSSIRTAAYFEEWKTCPACLGSGKKEEKDEK